MSTRREARIRAVQLLFQLNFTYKDYAPLLPREREALTQLYIFDRKELDSYAKRIYYGVIEQLDELDQWISRFAQHWKIDRMAKVDLTILRLGVYELFYCPDVPAASVINEAIELAKMFGEEDSPAFINGILDKISKSRASDSGVQMEIPPKSACVAGERVRPGSPSGLPLGVRSSEESVDQGTRAESS